MTKKRKAGSVLLPMIAKILSERVGDDPAELSDAELVRSLARNLSDTDDDFPPIACVLALGHHDPSPDEAEALAEAADQLTEIGLEFEPDQLRAVKRSEVFAEFQKKFRMFEPHGLGDQRYEAKVIWRASLRECALRAAADCHERSA
jgi:hypothetical protein